MAESKYEKLRCVLDLFLSDPSISEISIKFRKPFEITKRMFEELVSYYDSSNETSNGNCHIVEFVYDEIIDEGKIRKSLVKLTMEYYTDGNDEDKISLKEIQMWREVK